MTNFLIFPPRQRAGAEQIIAEMKWAVANEIGYAFDMSTPEYLICANCETPCYVFDWDSERAVATEALCATCGNDEPGDFMTQSDWDDQGG